MKAVWNNQVLAESDATVVVEGNHYFPADSVNKEFFETSDRTSVCGWKGTANYFSIKVGGKVNENAAWTYPDALEKAKNIEGYVAFWNGVEVSA